MKNHILRHPSQRVFSRWLGILLLAASGMLHARVFDAAISQEVGYQERLQVEGEYLDDWYSETSFSVAPTHPLNLFDGILTFGPRLVLGYRYYGRASELNSFIFTLEGPLALGSPLEVGQPTRGIGLLEINPTLSRKVEAVSETTDEVTQQTAASVETKLTRYIKQSRWKTELGYDYARTFYDDSEYSDLESDDHQVHLSLLYELNRDIDVGVQGSYGIELYSDDERSDVTTRMISALGRWRVTGKVGAGLQIGYETASYDGDEDDDSGLNLRGNLSWTPTPRWSYAAAIEHGLDMDTSGEQEQLTTTRAGLTVGHSLTEKAAIQVSPAVDVEDGSRTVTEYSLAAAFSYRFSAFMLSVGASVRDRHAGGNSNDSYTAMETFARASMSF